METGSDRYQGQVDALKELDAADERARDKEEKTTAVKPHISPEEEAARQKSYLDKMRHKAPLGFHRKRVSRRSMAEKKKRRAGPKPVSLTVVAGTIVPTSEASAARAVARTEPDPVQVVKANEAAMQAQVDEQVADNLRTTLENQEDERKKAEDDRKTLEHLATVATVTHMKATQDLDEAQTRLKNIPRDELTDEERLELMKKERAESTAAFLAADYGGAISSSKRRAIELDYGTSPPIAPDPREAEWRAVQQGRIPESIRIGKAQQSATAGIQTDIAAASARATAGEEKMLQAKRKLAEREGEETEAGQRVKRTRTELAGQTATASASREESDLRAFRLRSALDAASVRLPPSLRNNAEAQQLKTEREELIRTSNVSGDPSSIGSSNKDFKAWVDSQSSVNDLNARIDRFTALTANAASTQTAKKKANKVNKRIDLMREQRSQIEQGNVLASTVVFSEDKPAASGKPRKKRKQTGKTSTQPTNKPKTARGFITKAKKPRKRKTVKQKVAVPDVSRYFI